MNTDEPATHFVKANTATGTHQAAWIYSELSVPSKHEITHQGTGKFVIGERPAHLVLV